MKKRLFSNPVLTEALAREFWKKQVEIANPSRAKRAYTVSEKVTRVGLDRALPEVDAVAEAHFKKKGAA